MQCIPPLSAVLLLLLSMFPQTEERDTSATKAHVLHVCLRYVAALTDCCFVALSAFVAGVVVVLAASGISN